MEISYKIILEIIVFFCCLCNLVNSDSRDLYSARLRGRAFSCITAANASISFQNNVNLLLSSFTQQSSLRSYYSSSIGDSPDTVYGYIMCRADVSRQLCNSCILTGTQFAMEADCEHEDGILFSEMCVLRYANHSMRGLWNPYLHSSFDYVEVNVSNYQNYNQILSSTLEALIDKAAFGSDSNGSRPGFAIMEAGVTGTETIYSLAQCTPDIVGLNCSRCLRSGLSNLQTYANGAPGAIAIMAMCQLRYDNVSLYDLGVNSKGKALRSLDVLALLSFLFLFVHYSLFVLS